MLTVLAVPASLILLAVIAMPRSSSVETGFSRSQVLNGGSDGPVEQGSVDARYSIVIDAGSTGSRVHIFKFLTTSAGALDLQFDKFEQLKPGLSAHAADPVAAAASLKPLLALALEVIPKPLHAITHISVGATAGLRLLPGDSAENILQEVQALLKTYPFQSTDADVRILSGADEGAFAWLTLNYLLGHLGEHEDKTVAAIDLGKALDGKDFWRKSDERRTVLRGWHAWMTKRARELIHSVLSSLTRMLSISCPICRCNFM